MTAPTPAQRTAQRRGGRPAAERGAARRRAGWGLAAICLLALAGPRLAAQTAAKNSCLDCHVKLAPPYHVDADATAASIHTQKGITCTSCHGGDARSDDPKQAMSPAAHFTGPIARAQVPALCASCHANAAYIRGFDPSLRTDQFSQYQTSVHGQLLAKGDTHVAVCIDCHTAHAILPPNDPRSPVYPTNVATTCGRCHADATLMAPYKIPTNQLALYRTSVHYQALMVRGDISAPTCTTCHGSHGAAPPGVNSVALVCSTCHVFQGQLFASGPHGSAFAAMGLPGCITCHSNHGIQHPTDAFVGTGAGAVCTKCHDPGEPAYKSAGDIHDSLVHLAGAIQRSDAILGEAESSGMDVGDARASLSEASDDLTQARVQVHTVTPADVDQKIEAGLKIAASTYAAGQAAKAELQVRRKGLAAAVLAVLLVIGALFFYIRRLEHFQPRDSGAES